MDTSIDISIVIPAFNEAKRLPLFLQRVIHYCNSSKRIYEIIIVDDGSSDDTWGVAESYRQKFHNLHAVKIRKNRGKGYAVKRGLLKSNGKICVFLDADGSVGPEEIENNITYLLEDGYDIFIGSRVLKSKEQILCVKWHRKFTGVIFNFFVHFFLFKDIKDTQCGFKMFRQEVVRPLFSRSYLRGFGFDIEILYLANKMGYKVKEGPVSWHHVAGSKVNLLTDSLRMFFNILQVRNWHCTPINPFNKYMGPDEYKYMYEMENYHWWFVAKRNLVVSLIKGLRISSPVILDVGSGAGANLLSFSALGKVFGIDISKKAIEFCLKRGLKNVIQGPVEEIGFDDRAFGIITCLDVLEHLQDPQEALLELGRILKDKGRIIITVPAFRILWSQHDEALCHLKRYEKETLKSDLEEADFKVEKIGYLFFTSFFIVAPIRILRRFLIRPKTVHSDTTTLPPRLLNDFLKILFNIEIKFSINFGLPFGTTLYAIASKRSQSL